MTGKVAIGIRTLLFCNCCKFQGEFIFLHLHLVCFNEVADKVPGGIVCIFRRKHELRIADFAITSKRCDVQMGDRQVSSDMLDDRGWFGRSMQATCSMHARAGATFAPHLNDDIALYLVIYMW